jgi:hypothetical protein
MTRTGRIRFILAAFECFDLSFVILDFPFLSFSSPSFIIVALRHSIISIFIHSLQALNNNEAWIKAYNNTTRPMMISPIITP